MIKLFRKLFPHRVFFVDEIGKQLFSFRSLIHIPLVNEYVYDDVNKVTYNVKAINNDINQNRVIISLSKVSEMIPQDKELIKG